MIVARCLMVCANSFFHIPDPEVVIEIITDAFINSIIGFWGSTRSIQLNIESAFE